MDEKMLNCQASGPSLSRDASNALKGLLILLIVWGHNSILCRAWNGCQSAETFFYKELLYTFHVYCFFILPFFYNKNPYSKGNIRKNTIRLLYPYLWVTLLCLILNVSLSGQDFKGLAHFSWAMISGSDILLDEVIGFSFPWFLPTMFSLLILKDVYYSAGKYVRSVHIGIGLILWSVALSRWMNFFTMSMYAPFALVNAFRMLPVCLLTVWIAERMRDNMKTRNLVTFVFAFLSLLFWIFWLYDIRWGRMAFYFVMPVAAFLTLLQFKDYLAKSRLLIALGKLSLQIYLYHVIIFNVLLIVVKHFHCPPTLTDGVVVYVITLAISYFGAWLTTKVPLLRKILYPKA